MARDKLITIRIEGDKRKAFGDLAKSQNTDTASLLYDFISQCLDGEIDIKLVTGKGNRIDKIDNQIGSDRIDKLEATTQRIDERVGKLSKKLTDWIEAFDDRLNDSDQGLSDKMISLENRLNALASQLDSQRIDTDSQQNSQQDRQGENPDIEPVATVETAIDTVETVKENVEAVTEIDESDDESDTSPLPIIEESVEIADTVEPVSTVEPDTDAIETAIKVKPRRGYSNSELSEKLNISKSTIEKWKARIQRGEKFEPKVYPNFFDHWLLDTDNLWYPEGRLLKKP